ncbi:MAG: Unknown protein [uncultured Aureispira sp.]|uniref:Uncharacterized protein n=1 Tax=uncultured Aureispira sp. TaxID=1331704 RepID=A0A6S6T3A1_9BACT|nr:MAG: Unknown protein [uncultured Aureispira sp.]
MYPLINKYSNTLKKTQLFIVLIILLFGNLANAQVALEWAKNMGSQGDVCIGQGITNDLLGNVYITGQFEGTVDFDPSSDTYPLTAQGASDIFIQKLSPQGDFIWAKNMGGSVNVSSGESIAVDQWGYVYTTGYFDTRIDFDPNSGVSNLSSAGGFDIFIQKLSPQGNLVWAKRMGNSSPDKGFSIKVDRQGYVYTTGLYSSSVDFDPNAGTEYLNADASDSWNAYIQKLSPQGNLVWAKAIIGHSHDVGYSLDIDSSGNVYSTGRFSGTVDFDPGPGISNLTASSNDYDIYVQKLDFNGNFVWAKKIGGLTKDEGYSIVVGPSSNIYITGFFEGYVDFDPNAGTSYLFSNGADDLFIQKLDSSGNLVWAKSIGGTGNEIGRSISLDKYENVYCTGNFTGTVDFDPNVGVHNLTTSGALMDVFIVKLNALGAFCWASSMGSSSLDVGHSISLDKKGNIYTTGEFRGSTDFDPTSGVYNLNPIGILDLFIQKLSQKGVVGKAYQDFNQNCFQENNEIGLANKLFIIQPGNIVTTTNSNGFWQVDSLPAGNYTITADSSLHNWVSSCPLTQSFTVVNPDSITTGPSFGFTSTQSCSDPNVSMHAPFLRPGFSNQRVYVQVCNEAEASNSLNNSYVIVELDSLLTVDTASMPFSALGNNRYRVTTGRLNPGVCVTFSFSCSLSANAILGQTLCMNTALYPVDSCRLDSLIAPFSNGITPCLTAYDGSHLVIQPTCKNDTIKFAILNIGDGHMSCFSQVRLYIDGEYLWMDSIQLNRGDTACFIFPSDGRTHRLEVDQHPLHYGNSQPSSTIELCGNTANWTSDLVNILSQNDFDPFVDIFCGLVRGSYDPNDKTGYPIGLGATQDILPNQAIEYLINFQNTGTDTAFNVTIRDTLSTDFDISSVQSGVSSHAYNFRMYDARVLEWTFNNIMLADSNTNEPLSHGFIKFKVNQRPNLANNTIIENSAAIFFDFNAPIITNTSWHTINEHFLTISIDKVIEEQMHIRVYPNPTRAWIHMDRETDKEISILLFDNLGRTLISKKINTSTAKINLTAFPAGIYYLSVNDGEKSAVQKIIKQ